MTVMTDSEGHIMAGGFGTGSNAKLYSIHPYGYENSVFIVENNTTTTSTTIERIFTTPVIYFWMLLIFVFVMFRCGFQWLLETNAINAAIKRRRCFLICQDTVQISCGLAMNTKLFEKHSYGHKMLAQGATIIPLIAGMFLSGLLYGEYLIHSEVPNIDSIQQLEQSNLTICAKYSPEWGDNSRVKNKIVFEQVLEILDMIWSGNTSYAYIIPQHWTTVLNMDHLRPNGRPLFHVVKEPYGGTFQYFGTGQWFLQNRMNTIVRRLMEHGFVTHFKRVSKRTTKTTATEMQSNTMDFNSSVAVAGELQEILIACCIYLIGILFAIIVFILELYTRRHLYRVSAFRNGN